MAPPDLPPEDSGPVSSTGEEKDEDWRRPGQDRQRKCNGGRYKVRR